MDPWKLIVILFFSLVLRGFFSVTATPYLDSYDIDLVGQTIFNISLLFFACCEFRLNIQKIQIVLGRIEWNAICRGVGMGVVLFMFTLGQSALATLIIAQYDLPAAYVSGNFHDAHYGSHPFFSAPVILFVLSCACMPAVCEEFFFRGLFFRALSTNRSYLRAMFICSAMFAVLHFKMLINVANSFFFGIVACMLYLRQRSLYGCIAMHFTYNFSAFVVQHYFDFHRTRTIGELSSWLDWRPQLAMFGISVVVLGRFVYQRQGTFAVLLEHPLDGSRRELKV